MCSFAYLIKVACVRDTWLRPTVLQTAFGVFACRLFPQLTSIWFQCIKSCVRREQSKNMQLCINLPRNLYFGMFQRFHLGFIFSTRSDYSYIKHLTRLMESKLAEPERHHLSESFLTMDVTPYQQVYCIQEVSASLHHWPYSWMESHWNLCFELTLWLYL